MDSPLGWASLCIAQGANPKGNPTSIPNIFVFVSGRITPVNCLVSKLSLLKAVSFYWTVISSSAPEEK